MSERVKHRNNENFELGTRMQVSRYNTQVK